MNQQWFLWFVYNNPLGLPLLWLFRMTWFSEMMGAIFCASWSRFLIPHLIKMYHIQLDTYQIPEGGFRSVNDFFTRASLATCRLFPTNTSSLGSPVDGCIEVFQNIASTQDFCVKGYHANLEKLFWPTISQFVGGDVCFCRLRFSDYHRFHFFDDGEILGSWERSGPLYSVDNTVLETGLWTKNKSHLMHLRTKNFWQILWLEVGATNVGSITNHKDASATFLRGEEKGYFSLGGSAVLLVFQKGSVQWWPTLLEKSQRHEEYEVVTGGILWRIYQ